VGVRRRLGRYLKFKRRYLRGVLSERKHSTIRLGLVRPEYQRVYIECGGKVYGEAIIGRVRYLRLSELSEEDALRDGFTSLEDLFTNLESIYPSLKPSDWVTVIEFEVVEKFNPPLDKRDLTSSGEYVRIARLGLAYNAYRSSEERRILAAIVAGGGLLNAVKELDNMTMNKAIRVLNSVRGRLRRMGLIA